MSKCDELMKNKLDSNSIDAWRSLAFDLESQILRMMQFISAYEAWMRKDAPSEGGSIDSFNLMLESHQKLEADIEDLSLGVCQEIIQERNRQNMKWGGDDNDDLKGPIDWVDHIKCYVSWAWNMWRLGSEDKYRRRMVQVAALAVAAIESLDRKEAAAENRINSLQGDNKGC